MRHMWRCRLFKCEDTIKQSTNEFIVPTTKGNWTSSLNWNEHALTHGHTATLLVVSCTPQNMSKYWWDFQSLLFTGNYLLSTLILFLKKDFHFFFSVDYRHKCVAPLPTLFVHFVSVRFFLISSLSESGCSCRYILTVMKNKETGFRHSFSIFFYLWSNDVRASLCRLRRTSIFILLSALDFGRLINCREFECIFHVKGNARGMWKLSKRREEKTTTSSMNKWRNNEEWTKNLHEQFRDKKKTKQKKIDARKFMRWNGRKWIVGSFGTFFSHRIRHMHSWRQWKKRAATTNTNFES